MCEISSWAPCFAAFLPQVPSDVRGQAELHGTLHGPLKRRDQIEAEVDIPTLNLTYQSLQIGNASPIRAVYRGGVISIDACELKGTGTDLQIQAAIPLESSSKLAGDGDRQCGSSSRQGALS